MNRWLIPHCGKHNILKATCVPCSVDDWKRKVALLLDAIEHIVVEYCDEDVREDMILAEALEEARKELA